MLNPEGVIVHFMKRALNEATPLKKKLQSFSPPEQKYHPFYEVKPMLHQMVKL